MAATDDRFMRLMVFFDLPVLSKAERRCATQFRKFLLNDGYFMLQWSVYCRICRGEDNVDTHLNRLKAALPPKGSIRSLQITDQQYGRMQLLLGAPQKEDELGCEQLLLF